LITIKDKNAKTCTHPGENAMCSQEGIRSAAAEAAPTTGTLLVKKINECLGIGFCPVPSAFTITVTGNNPTPSTFQGSTEGLLLH